MNKLQYFKGKLCTILTSPAGRFFNEVEFANVFLGIIDEIDEFGIWLIQLTEMRKSFFTHRSLVGIIEEKCTILDDDQAKQVREQLETRIPPKNAQQLISIDSLKKIKNTNQTEKK